MGKSAFVERLDEVEASLTILLKPLGFRRKGRSFNRSAEDGVIQVINLQSGQFEIGVQHPLPPELAHLRADHYGQLAVNLGVCVREIWEQGAVKPWPKFLPEHHCQIRMRLGSVAHRKDYWWSLKHPASVILEDVGKLLIDEGLSFLERFETRDAILRDWVAMNDGPECLSARARVDVAVMLAKRGETAEATRLLEEQIRRSHLKGHIEYVRELAGNLGLGELST